VAASRYAASPLAPCTEAETSLVCGDCGTVVADTAAHDKFHSLLRQLAPAGPRGETRGKA
jgi:hypothetical protein